MRGRFGELLLLLPPLQNIARLMVDLVTRYNQDTKHVDDLINEMLLNRYRDDCQEAVISTTTNTIYTNANTTSSSPSTSISKENDLDSNASSIDTDMEDNLSQDSHQYDHLSSTTPVANSVLIVPRRVDDDLHNVSLNENDDYLSNNLSHIHLLHRTVTTDPNLNHHNTTINNNQHVLQYFTDTSNERLKLIKSKSIVTPSPTNTSNYDPNSDINFLYDLVTPPSIRQSIQTNSNTNDTHFFDPHWNA
jgi:hypothetical protein